MAKTLVALGVAAAIGVAALTTSTPAAAQRGLFGYNYSNCGCASRYNSAYAEPADPYVYTQPYVQSDYEQYEQPYYRSYEQPYYRSYQRPYYRSYERPYYQRYERPYVRPYYQRHASYRPYGRPYVRPYYHANYRRW